MYLNNNRLSEKIIWVLVTFLFAAFTIFDENAWISIILLATTIGIFCLDVYQGHGKTYFKMEMYHYTVLAFSLFCLLSALWAIRPGNAIQKGITIIEILVCMSVIYVHYSKAVSIKPLISAVMWAEYIVVIYAIGYYGMNTIKLMLDSGDRLENSFTNINSIGMVAAIATVLTCFRICFVMNKFTIDNILTIPCVVMIAATGSRKALIMAVVGTVLVLMKRFASSNIIKNIVIWCILGIFLFIVFYYLSTLPLFEGVMKRMQGLGGLISGQGKIEHSAWLREQYIKIGIKEFKKSPIVGWGIGSSGALLSQNFGRDTYFHNNFVELLACGGIAGFAVYYNIYLCLGKNFIKYRKFNSPYSYLCIVLMLLLLFMDYASVSYYSKERYFYFMILFLEIHYIKRTTKEKNLDRGKEKDGTRFNK